MGRTTAALPLPVKRALRKLGADMRDARKRRRLPLELLAKRALTSHVTLRKAERGDPTVSIAVYANALFSLGLVDRLGDVADSAADTIGMVLESERLPLRARLARGASSARSARR